jgi:hypothetical protein
MVSSMPSLRVLPFCVRAVRAGLFGGLQYLRREAWDSIVGGMTSGTGFGVPVV